MLRVLATAFAVLAGLAFGSFLNVCVTRWPQGESIVSPRSHCRNCNRTLAWWENIPLASWLVLRGRCRTCNRWIGWRYPLVEVAVGGLWSVTCSRFLDGVSELHELSYHTLIAAIVSVILLWLLVALAVLDMENLWLPNFLVYPGILLGLIYSVANEELLWSPYGGYGGPRIFAGRLMLVVLKRLIGALFAAGLILLIRGIYWLIRRREGIGLGDAKLMAMLAAWLGFSRSLLAFGLGVVLGAVAALVVIARHSPEKSEDHWSAAKLPLGTFLCIGGIVASLWGNQIIAAYLHWAGFY